MALFLMEYLLDQIIILGGWKSKAFLIYIRAQIIKYTKNFLSNMISFNNFFELSSISNKLSNKDKDLEVQKVHYWMKRVIAV